MRPLIQKVLFCQLLNFDMGYEAITEVDKRPSYAIWCNLITQPAPITKCQGVTLLQKHLSLAHWWSSSCVLPQVLFWSSFSVNVTNSVQPLDFLLLHDFLHPFLRWIPHSTSSSKKFPTFCNLLPCSLPLTRESNPHFPRSVIFHFHIITALYPWGKYESQD